MYDAIGQITGDLLVGDMLARLERYAEARVLLERIPGMADTDVMDPVHKETAARLLNEIREKN